MAYLVPAVAPGRAMATRRPSRQLAAVLEEFGWRTHVGNGGNWPAKAVAERDMPILDGADLVVCWLPDAAWLPSAELAIAAAAGQERIVLVPGGDVIAGTLAEVLDGVSVVRYAAGRAGEALHGVLRDRHTSGDELASARAGR
jgi:hypothetical protein